MANVERKLRLLIVEDSDDDLLLLLRELRRGGYDPDYRRVCTPEDMHAALDEPDWDIVISDWSMPRFNGLAAFHLMKARKLDIPFIIVSGTIGEDVAVEALKAGVHDFMSKGLFARLLPAIERELREADIRRRQRVADIELERRRAQIEQSERLLRIVLESVPDGVVVVDAAGEHLMSNPAAEELLGMSTSDLAPERFSDDYGVFLPDQTTPFPTGDLALTKALGGSFVSGQEQFVKNPGLPSGSWLSVNARPLHDSTDRIRGAVAVFRDVTKEKTTQEHLLVSDRMASIGMLAAGVGHEINNPLAAVLANLELIKQDVDQRAEEGAPPFTELKEMVDDAHEAAVRVREIVGDLRVFSRQDDARNVEVDLHRVLDSSVRLGWNEIRHRSRLEKAYGAPPRVLATESRLGQVFLNLLVNAAQAIPEGAAQQNMIRVKTGADAEGRAVVEISDTGGGMPPETLARIFTPFFTTKPSGVGTGLGLTISQRIVTSLGGEITARSEVGKGTTFRVVLPPAAPRAEPSVEPVRVETDRPVRRARVLIVDDDTMVTLAIRRVLARAHEVSTAASTSEVLERLGRGETFDAIVCELTAAGMTGMDLHARLAASRPEQADRIVFLTDGIFSPEARAFLGSTPNARLEKPFDARHLLAIVEKNVH